jgi:hypothetical protein
MNIMKKLLLGLMIVVSLSMFGQESVNNGTFVRKYTKYLITKNDVSEAPQYSLTTVVYNENNTTDIGLYFGNNKVLLYSSGKVETGTTNNGTKYQLVKCINKDKGNVLYLQLFDTVLRIFTNENFKDSIEYFN